MSLYFAGILLNLLPSLPAGLVSTEVIPAALTAVCAADLGASMNGFAPAVQAACAAGAGADGVDDPTGPLAVLRDWKNVANAQLLALQVMTNMCAEGEEDEWEEAGDDDNADEMDGAGPAVAASAMPNGCEAAAGAGATGGTAFARWLSDSGLLNTWLGRLCADTSTATASAITCPRLQELVALHDELKAAVLDALCNWMEAAGWSLNRCLRAATSADVGDIADPLSGDFCAQQLVTRTRAQLSVH